MAKLINSGRKQQETRCIAQEGEIICKWFSRRMIINNKNILVAVTGTTGSGKSYACHRIAELWYEYHFNKPYPVETHTCFSISEAMDLLASGKLKRGELLILEEAGVNMGSLDFQNKVSKLFSYVLQSFRSMNVGILFNLPVLSMLNKSARLLIHSHIITNQIDYQNKKSKVKVFIHQANQHSGKIYSKFMRIKHKGRIVPIKKMSFSMPSESIRTLYEERKHKFVTNLNKGFKQELDKTQMIKDAQAMIKQMRPGLSPKNNEVFDLLEQGKKVIEIAEILKISPASVSQQKKRCERLGYYIKKTKNA